MDRIDQLAGRIPARGLTVRPTLNQQGFLRPPAGGLPLAENARNVPSDDFEQRMPTPPPPPANQRVPVPWLTPPTQRSSTSIHPFSYQPRARLCARPSTIVTSTPLRSAVHRCTSRPAMGTVIVGL